MCAWVRGITARKGALGMTLLALRSTSRTRGQTQAEMSLVTEVSCLVLPVFVARLSAVITRVHTISLEQYLAGTLIKID